MRANTSIGPTDILVHIGSPKTGTTYLQDCLDRKRTDLLDAGVLYPATPWLNHVRHLLGPLRWFRNDPALQAEADDLWHGLVGDVRAHQGRTIISAENAVIANPDMIGQIVDDLGRDHVQVLITARPVADVLAGFWQEEVRWGATITFDQWVDGVLESAARPNAHPFWACHDHAAIVERWVEATNAQQVTVAIARPDQPSAITNAVEQLLGVPGGMLTHQGNDTARTNRSLTMAEVELVRRLNAVMTDPSRPAQMDEILRLATIDRLVEGRRPGRDEPAARPSRPVVESLVPVSVEVVERLRAANVRVIGDPDTLVADPLRFDETGYMTYDEQDHLRVDSAVLIIEHLLRSGDGAGPHRG